MPWRSTSASQELFDHRLNIGVAQLHPAKNALPAEQALSHVFVLDDMRRRMPRPVHAKPLHVAVETEYGPQQRGQKDVLVEQRTALRYSAEAAQAVAHGARDLHDFRGRSAGAVQVELRQARGGPHHLQHFFRRHAGQVRAGLAPERQGAQLGNGTHGAEHVQADVARGDGDLAHGRARGQGAGPVWLEDGVRDVDGRDNAAEAGRDVHSLTTRPLRADLLECGAIYIRGAGAERQRELQG